MINILKSAKFITFLLLTQISCENIVSFKDIVKQITENEFEPYQTMIIYDEKTGCLEVKNEILRSTFNTNPSRVINFIDAFDLKNSIGFKRIYKTTLLVFVLEDNQDDIGQIFRIVEFVSKVHTLPRCLLIFLLNGKTSSREDLLRLAWDRQMIHLTILDVEEDKNRDQRLLHFQISKNQKNIVIHHFNKFNGKYMWANYSKEDVIFPNKMSDLNGFEMKTISTEYDYDNTILGSYGKSIFMKVDDMNNERMKTVAKIMNFTLLNFFDKRMRASDYQDFLKRGSYQLILEPLFLNINEEWNCASTYKFDNYRFVVPILKKEKYSLLGLKESLFLAALTILIVIIIWMILWILKFDRRFWQLLHILQFLLGMPVLSDVRRLCDRIALLTILYSFWLFSSSLYSILTNVRVTPVTEDLVINSIDELRDFGEDFATADFFYVKRNGSEVSLVLDKDSNRYTSDTVHVNCLVQLVKNKTTGCSMSNEDTMLALAADVSENGFQKIKILKGSFARGDNTIVLEENSPFTFEFETYFMKFTENGLLSKWSNDIYNQIPKRALDEDVYLTTYTISSLILPLFTIVIGYGISIFVFLVELFIHRNRQ